MTLAVWAAPGARRTEVVGEAGGLLRIRVAAPAIEGKANRELCRFLAERARIPLRHVRIKVGDAGRRKLIVLDGVNAEDLVRALLP